jgi:hypothetical protein
VLHIHTYNKQAGRQAGRQARAGLLQGQIVGTNALCKQHLVHRIDTYSRQAEKQAGRKAGRQAARQPGRPPGAGLLEGHIIGTNGLCKQHLVRRVDTCNRQAGRHELGCCRDKMSAPTLSFC